MCRSTSLSRFWSLGIASLPFLLPLVGPAGLRPVGVAVEHVLVAHLRRDDWRCGVAENSGLLHRPDVAVWERSERLRQFVESESPHRLHVTVTDAEFRPLLLDSLDRPLTEKASSFAPA